MVALRVVSGGRTAGPPAAPGGRRACSRLCPEAQAPTPLPGGVLGGLLQLLVPGARFVPIK